MSSGCNQYQHKPGCGHPQSSSTTTATSPFGAWNPEADKTTRFEVCDRHRWHFAGVTRDRAAEIFVEGGPAAPVEGLGWCTGDGCRLYPGTDLFAADFVAEGVDGIPAGDFGWAFTPRRFADT